MALKTIHAPLGRMQEHVAKLTEDERRRAAIKAGTRLGQDDTLKVWPSRGAMARTIRMQERSSPAASWRPVVKLTDGEGY